MMDLHPLSPTVVFHIGPLEITEAVVTTWGLMAVLVVGAILSVRHFTQQGSRWQTVLEMVVEAITGQIGDVMKSDPRPFLPLFGTLFLYLLVANLSAMVPGVHAPTAQLETAAALALIVFASVHAFGILRRGLRGYLAHYLKPNPVMLPLNVLSEITRTLSLMVRLFGNIMSHELVIAVVLTLAGLLVPVPIMALGILIGVIQAYIFAMLATVFIGAAVGAVDAG